MARNRGSRKNKRGKLNWSNRKANAGRRPSLGKKKHFIRWPEVRAKMMRERTIIVAPTTADAQPEADAAE